MQSKALQICFNQTHPSNNHSHVEVESTHEREGSMKARAQLLFECFWYEQARRRHVADN